MEADWSAMQAEIGISAPKMSTSVKEKWSPAQSTTSGMILRGILKRQSKNGSMMHMTLEQSLLETKTKMSNTFCSLFVASLTGYAIFSDNEVVFLLRDAYIGGSGGNMKPAGIEPATLTLKLSPEHCESPRSVLKRERIVEA